MTSQTRNSAALLLCGLLALSGCASNQDQHPHAAGETSAARETQTWPLVSPDLRVDFGKVSQSTTSEVVDVLSVELRRSFELLRAQRDPVHFLAYQVVEEVRVWDRDHRNHQARFELPEVPVVSDPEAGRYVLDRPRHPVTVIWE